MKAIYDNRPEELLVGMTSVTVCYNIEQITVVIDDEGTTAQKWQCDYDRISISEYNTALNGKYDGTWTPALHKAFRQHQHDHTLGLYDLARRKVKTDDRWNAYIDSLDAWNEAVSALATDFSTDVPPLPAQPE